MPPREPRLATDTNNTPRRTRIKSTAKLLGDDVGWWPGPGKEGDCLKEISPLAARPLRVLIFTFCGRNSDWVADEEEEERRRLRRRLRRRANRPRARRISFSEQCRRLRLRRPRPRPRLCRARPFLADGLDWNGAPLQRSEYLLVESSVRRVCCPIYPSFPNVSRTNEGKFLRHRRLMKIIPVTGVLS